ncbi:bile acid transporter [Tatumella ptyseos]|uniref:Bile acid transporter n=1 Tax=Tatumella ptyseos TaxID=82987 RepID=A0A2X5PJG6_9GAMM|nr:bile acid transporter [Tatumella ptyseos]
MILVGSVASGTASNVMIYLAKGDVALSVTISSVSALVGVVATPLLTRLYVDTHIQVDIAGMLWSIIEIVLIPIGLGLIVHHSATRLVKKAEPYLPAFSMVCILLIISAVVAGSRAFIGSVGLVVIAAVILHNAIGLLGGYFGGKLFGFDESTCRTLALEVGMQNSGLAATLGKLYFTRSPHYPALYFPSGITFPALYCRVTGQANRLHAKTKTRDAGTSGIRISRGGHFLPAVPAHCKPQNRKASSAVSYPPAIRDAANWFRYSAHSADADD